MRTGGEDWYPRHGPLPHDPRSPPHGPTGPLPAEGPVDPSFLLNPEGADRDLGSHDRLGVRLLFQLPGLDSNSIN